MKFSRVMSSADSFDENTVPFIRAEVNPLGEGHMMKDMKNLDPKGIFANERTLLHYAEKGMYIGALAVVLCHSDNMVTKLLGLLLSVCTCIFYVWALIEYYGR